MNAPGQLQSGPGPESGVLARAALLGTRLHDRSRCARSLPTSLPRDVGDTIYSGAFADNEASLRVQEKLGFVRDGETTLHSKPRGADFPHVNTKLTRSAFEARST